MNQDLNFVHFYLPSKYLGMCVHRYTYNYGLYLPGPELQPYSISFLHITSNNGEEEKSPFA